MNILVLCTGSQLARRVNPGAIVKLQAEGHSTDDLSSKSWGEFSEPTAFDLAYRQLRNRIADTLELPLDSTDARHLKDAQKRIHDAAVGKERLDA